MSLITWHTLARSGAAQDGPGSFVGLAVGAIIAVAAAVVSRTSAKWSQKVNRLTVILTCTSLAVMLWITLWDGRKTTLEAFGEAPFGIPWYVVVPLGVFLLGAPLPLVIWTLLAQTFVGAGYVAPNDLSPDFQRRSRWGLVAGLYFVGLVIAWICYTASRGI